MKKSKIIVVYSTHHNENENNEFINHIHDTIGKIDHEVIDTHNNNEFSLSELYNKAMRYNVDPKAIFVFCHNDIILKTKGWGKLLLNHFNHSSYGILGVAGSVLMPENGIWWDDRSKMFGTVEHTNGINSWFSEYSGEISGQQSVINVDGLFIAVHPERIICNFDERYGKFHFYDVSFCVSNYLAGVDVGVISNIKIKHKSVGAVDDNWEKNRVKFVENNNLPIRHFSEDSLNILICCNSFKSLTGSEMSNYELAKELKRAGNKVTIIAPSIGEPLYSKATKLGIKVCSFENVPNYIIDQDGKYRFHKNDEAFDILHINHKPIGERILEFYPNTPAVMHIRSTLIPYLESPIINPMVKKYISMLETVTDYIKSFGISANEIIEIANPFDFSRFNSNYNFIENKKKTILFVGTIDYLRIAMIDDLIKITKANGETLWIIGKMNGVDSDFSKYEHVKYFGVKPDVENYIKKCDIVAGIYKGRTAIEGFLCNKPALLYDVDEEGTILSSKLYEVPADLSMYSSKFSAEKVLEVYDEVIDNYNK